MKKLIVIPLLILIISACESVDEITNILQGPDIVAGLKEALKVGTDSATANLGAIDGYLQDEAVKILLPTEMQTQINNFKAIEIDVFGFGSISGESLYYNGFNLGITSIPSLASFEDDLIIGINRAAESAAVEAGPIFVNAITSMTFNDANNILFGPDTAATRFFIDNTYDDLFSLYEPKLDEAISEVKVGDESVENLYASFVNTYNSILETSIPTGLVNTSSLADLSGLELLSNPDLSQHATEKGLDGLFLKVKNEEKNIRENPAARVTQLLKDVFSLQD